MRCIRVHVGRWGRPRPSSREGGCLMHIHACGRMGEASPILLGGWMPDAYACMWEVGGGWMPDA